MTIWDEQNFKFNKRVAEALERIATCLESRTIQPSISATLGKIDEELEMMKTAYFNGSTDAWMIGLYTIHELINREKEKQHGTGNTGI